MKAIYFFLLVIKTIFIFFIQINFVYGSSVITYPKANYSETSSVFTLTANNNEIDVVYLYNDYHYAHFSFNGTVQINIAVNETIENFEITPKSLNIQAIKSGNTLSFSIKPSLLTPNYLVIYINNLEKLCVLADPLETNVPPSSGPKIFNITKWPYMADPTGINDATEIVQKAIDDCGKAGGGVVYVPKGVYKITGIKNKPLGSRMITISRDNIELYLEGGGVLKSSPDRSDYPEDTFEPSFMPIFFKISNCKNIKITGRGVLDASGFHLMNKDPDENGFYANRRNLLQTNDVDNLTIEGVVLKDGTVWGAYIINSTKALVRNVKVLNYCNAEKLKVVNDGIDIASSRNVRVDRNFIITVDDAMCAKASVEGVPMYDMFFTNNVVYTSCAGNKTGMQSRGLNYDIWFINNDILKARRGIVIDGTDGNAPVYDIHFVDIRVEKQVPTSVGNQRNIDFTASTTSVFEVELSNVSFEEKHESRFTTRHNYGIENIFINDVTVAGEKIFYSSSFNINGFVENIYFNNGKSTRPSLYLSDIAGHWAEEFIEGMTLRGLMKSEKDFLFLPNQSMTRAEFILLLMKVLNINPDNTNQKVFVDVDENKYYYHHVNTASKLGIIENENNCFYPESEIIRQDMMMMVYNALKIYHLLSLEVDVTILESYKDYRRIASHVKQCIATLIEEGYHVTGDSSDIINPRGVMNRADAAAILSKVYRKKKDKEAMAIDSIAKLRIKPSVSQLVKAKSVSPEIAKPGFSTSTILSPSLYKSSSLDFQTFTTSKQGVVTWNPEIKTFSNVRIFVWRVANKATGVHSYEVFANGEMSIWEVDFGQGKSGFVDIGTYEFSGMGNEYVRLLMPGGEVQRIAEVKFELLEGEKVVQTIIVEPSNI